MDILDEIAMLVKRDRERAAASLDFINSGSASNTIRDNEFDDLPHLGPLAQIAKMIDQHTVAAREIGIKLDAHADRVYGPVPQEADNDVRDANVRSAIPALERIFIALGNLDRAMSAMAIAAGRNSTLA